jgi:hypothetical protein
MATNVTAARRGFIYDPVNSRLVLYVNGAEAGNFTSAAMIIPGTFEVTGAQTLTGLATLTAGATTPAAYTSTVVGDAFIADTGNVSIGTPGAFATTEPQGAVVMGGASLGGIAPVGAITTAGAVFASDTAVMKIVAGGTADTIQT